MSSGERTIIVIAALIVIIVGIVWLDNQNRQSHDCVQHNLEQLQNQGTDIQKC